MDLRAKSNTSHTSQRLCPSVSHIDRRRFLSLVTGGMAKSDAVFCGAICSNLELGQPPGQCAWVESCHMQLKNRRWHVHQSHVAGTWSEVAWVLSKNYSTSKGQHRATKKYRLLLQSTEIRSIIVLKISNAHHWKALFDARLVVCLGPIWGVSLRQEKW